MKKSLRLISLILCLLFGPVAYLIISMKGMTFLNWFIPAAFLLSLLFIGIWFLIFGKAAFKIRLQRFFTGIGLFILTGIAASQLLRYEGSSSGSSFPKFSWKWAPEISTEIEAEKNALPSAATSAADLLNFLGPDRNGKWDKLHFNPDWKSHPPELVWRRPIGKAWSSFVVKGNRAITQQQNGDNEEVICLDISTGDELWSHADKGVRLLLEKAENGGAAMGGDGPRSTPTISGDRVFSLGSTGIANCLDLNTGRRLWSHNVIKEHKGEIQRWGSANAPLVISEENLVVFAGSDQPGATLIACDTGTGTTRWIYRGSGASYSSPRILTLNGVEQIVSVNAKDVTGLTIDDGKELWKYEWPGSYPKVGQPLKAAENRILVTASYGVDSHLMEISKNGAEWTATGIWKSIRMKTKFSSAVILGEHIYGLDEARLACIELETGKKAWKGEKFGFGQHLLFGNQLLIQGEEGFLATGTISPDGYTETGRIDALSSMTWNVPAIAGRLLLVRNDREAACFLLPEKGSAN
ncbi:PQQ-binding-like beta-propeller repeat protein [Verrucomicrobiales bacterium BCK34]|nr:PQQ-binding-like beta-propeller repeat protein [Verrucomicrobiales bacterium BCK34]